MNYQYLFQLLNLFDSKIIITDKNKNEYGIIFFVTDKTKNIRLTFSTPDLTNNIKYKSSFSYVKTKVCKFLSIFQYVDQKSEVIITDDELKVKSHGSTISVPVEQENSSISISSHAYNSIVLKFNINKNIEDIILLMDKFLNTVSNRKDFVVLMCDPNKCKMLFIYEEPTVFFSMDFSLEDISSSICLKLKREVISIIRLFLLQYSDIPITVTISPSLRVRGYYIINLVSSESKLSVCVPDIEYDIIYNKLNSASNIFENRTVEAPIVININTKELSKSMKTITQMIDVGNRVNQIDVSLLIKDNNVFFYLDFIKHSVNIRIGEVMSSNSKNMSITLSIASLQTFISLVSSINIFNGSKNENIQVKIGIINNTCIVLGTGQLIYLLSCNIQQ